MRKMCLSGKFPAFPALAGQEWRTPSPADLPLYCIEEGVGTQVGQVVADAAHLVGQGLCKAAIEGHVLHVDDDGTDFFIVKEGGHSHGLFLRGHAGHTYVAGAVGQEHDQRAELGIAALGVFDYLPGGEETATKWCLSTHREVLQGPFGELDAVGRRQDDTGLVALKDDEPDLVAALIRFDQEAEDRALCGLHAFAGRHRPAGVNDEEDEIACAADADFALQIGHTQLQREVALTAGVPFLLVGGGIAQGGIECDVVVFFVGWARLDVTAALAVRPAVGALAGLFARHFVERRIQFTGFEDLSDVDRFAGSLFVSG